LNLHRSLFAILRHSVDEKESILALNNFSNVTISFQLPEAMEYPLADLFSDKLIKKSTELELEPYQVLWLKNTKEI